MNIIQYLKETRGEINHVSWPTKNQAVFFTVLVIVISLLTGMFLGFLDFFLSELLERIIF
jgi:preprotein translocase SecE subunit